MDIILNDFQSDIWTLFPALGALGWEAYHGVETLHSSGRIFAAEISLPILSHFMWVWGQVFSHLCPFYLSQCGFFGKSLVTRLLFS